MAHMKLVLLLFCPAVVVAQSVDIRLREDSAGRPVAGALVRLLGPRGVAAQGLSNEAGRVVLRAGEAGEYRIKVDRIGWAGVTAGPYALEAGTTILRDVRMAGTGGRWAGRRQVLRPLPAGPGREGDGAGNRRVSVGGVADSLGGRAHGRTGGRAHGRTTPRTPGRAPTRDPVFPLPARVQMSPGGVRVCVGSSRPFCCAASLPAAAVAALMVQPLLHHPRLPLRRRFPPRW